MSAKDFCGLETVELCWLGETKDAALQGNLTKPSLARNRVNAFIFLRRLQKDTMLPKLTIATGKTLHTDYGQRVASLRLISATTPLRKGDSATLQYQQ
jgi:hypothetical protein